MHLILFSLLLPVFAESSDLRNLIEKTYTRDNTFCKLGKGDKIEFQIRSDSKFTEHKNDVFGNHVLFYPEEEKAKLLPLNKDKMHTFRFFAGKGSLCSKSYGFKLSNGKTAILFQIENLPYMEKLAIVLLDSKTLEPLEAIETEYMSDRIENHKDGFAFRTMVEKHTSAFGTLPIKGLEYTYQDREFFYWMTYSPSGFKTNEKISYKNSNWKNFFKTEKEFLTSTGWDESEKKFKNTYVYLAVNHAQKKECILFSREKIKPNGSENWICR